MDIHLRSIKPLEPESASRYTGEINSSGKPNGSGAAYLDDGTFYYGEWVNGKIQGHGLLCLADTILVGNFTEGKLNDYGCEHRISG